MDEPFALLLQTQGVMTRLDSVIGLCSYSDSLGPPEGIEHATLLAGDILFSRLQERRRLHVYVLTLILNTVVNLYVISEHPLMAFIAGLLYK
jgi:hypothetical protein